MLKGQNILCLGSEKWGYPGFQQTAMAHLATANRVLFLNPVGIRKATPSLANIRFYAAKLRSLAARRRPATGDQPVIVFTAKLVPLVYSRWAQRLNRRLLARQVNPLLRELQFDDFILWIGAPTAFFSLDVFRPALTVYNPVDLFRAFDFVDRVRITAYEEEVARRSDLVLCTADAIRGVVLPHNANCYTIPHAVDFDRFHGGRGAPCPPELAGLPRPVIGFFGGLANWVDFELLGKVARAYPRASVVLIGGRVVRDIAGIDALPNVHLLGRRPVTDLPAYLNQFDVCLIPYVINERLKAVDPIKLREYLAQGKPVVSVDLPEVRKLATYCYVAADHQAFVAAIGRALADRDDTMVRQRIEVARASDLGRRLEEMSSLIEGALASKAAKIGRRPT